MATHEVVGRSNGARSRNLFDGGSASRNNSVVRYCVVHLRDGWMFGADCHRSSLYRVAGSVRTDGVGTERNIQLRQVIKVSSRF